MELPESLSMRETMHGHGAKGMAFYGYEDTADLGVQMEARRQNGRSAFVETWFHEALPETKFASFAELRAALLLLTDEQVEAEASKYPRFRSTEPDPCGNACRLCPRPPFVPGAPPVKHDTWRVHVALGWRAVTDWSASLCDSHQQQYDGDAAGLVSALDAEVAQRKARADKRLESLVKPDSSSAPEGS